MHWPLNYIDFLEEILHEAVPANCNMNGKWSKKLLFAQSKVGHILSIDLSFRQHETASVGAVCLWAQREADALLLTVSHKSPS